MNSYLCSNGSRIPQSKIESLIKKAKAKVLENQIDSDGFNHCISCGKSSGVMLDCAHVVSVKKAKEMGKTELCYDVNNIEILCRDCHQKYDKLNTQFTADK